MAAITLPRPKFVHLGDVAPRPGFLAAWERTKHRQAHWFIECLAEFTGVFLYTFAGVGATAAFVLGNLINEELSSLFQVGAAYAIGIIWALSVCSATSGGHFNPAVTITFVLTRKFPPLKAVRYIIAQILGGYVACLLIYAQYRHLILTVEQSLAAAGKLAEIQFTPQGPAGIFGLYVLPGSSLGQVFLNEFVCDFVLGMIIWCCLDPTNFLATPTTAPWIIALTYATVIWGYAPVGLAANAARDVGGRLAAITLWGRAASGGSYAAIAALTNIPATILGAMFYEFAFADGSRVVTPAHVEFLSGHHAAEEHAHNTIHRSQSSESGDSASEEKVTFREA